MAQKAEKVPRPANCFLQFLSAAVKDLRDKGQWGNRRMPDFVKEVSTQWREASQADRDKYIALALTAKEDHKRRYPKYQYRPRKRSKKTADAKTGDAISPSASSSPSSSSTSSSSSAASTPAPTTPTATMLAGESSTFGNASGFNFGEALHIDHHVPPGAHTTHQLQHSGQSNGSLWSPQVAGWLDPSTSISMPQNNNFALLAPKGDEGLQGLFQTSYYQPHSHAPQQTFPPFAPGVKLQTGFMAQQPLQRPPQQAFQPALQQPHQSLQHPLWQTLQPASQQASQMTLSPVPLPPQAHADTVLAQTQSESVAAVDGQQTTELEAWDKEFGPLDAGFCDFSSAWNDVKASDTPASTSESSATPLLATDDGPSASAALPPTVADNLNINVNGDQAQALPSETQAPYLLSPSPLYFDPSFLLSSDNLLWLQNNQLYDPFLDLPPSAVWPEELNIFSK